MPTVCIVMGCSNRSNRDKVKFFAVPSLVPRYNYMRTPELLELLRRRREKWLEAINRDDLTESKLKSQKVCSKHFYSGEAADVDDEDNPDWVPTLYMGHHTENLIKQTELERKMKLAKQGGAKRTPLPKPVHPGKIIYLTAEDFKKRKTTDKKINKQCKKVVKDVTCVRKEDDTVLYLMEDDTNQLKQKNDILDRQMLINILSDDS